MCALLSSHAAGPAAHRRRGPAVPGERPGRHHDPLLSPATRAAFPRSWSAGAALAIAAAVPRARPPRPSLAAGAPPSDGGRAWPSLRDLPPLRGPLGLAMAAYQVCYFPRGHSSSGVAAAALLAICSAPLLIAVLAPARPARRAPLPRLVRLSPRNGGRRNRTARGRPARGLDQVTGHFGLGALTLALGRAGVSYAVYAVAAQGAFWAPRSRRSRSPRSTFRTGRGVPRARAAPQRRRPPLARWPRAWPPLPSTLGGGSDRGGLRALHRGTHPRAPPPRAGIRLAARARSPATTLGLVVFRRAPGGGGGQPPARLLLLLALALLTTTARR